MNQRLELCREEHDHVVFDDTFIPERLLDVSSETPRLRLRKDILQSGCSSDLKYSALSYCWGSGESQAKTYVATLHDRQAGIREAEIPLVLRDAIRVTRALGISFLWIDALCILQDDISDWERQCAEMHTIYGSAHVTLCIANTRSCSEGFLEQTSPCVRLAFQSLREPDIASSFLVRYMNLLPGHQYRNWPPIFHSFQLLLSDVEESRWKERGWVFQEDKLSTRKLIFGRCNLYFVCHDFQHARGKKYPSDQYGPLVGRVLAKEDLNSMYDDWDDNILRTYSTYDASTFSFAADILPALAGLARLFGNRLKDSYYAGHWERDLYRSLSWESSISYSEPVQPVGIIIPSWSRLAKGHTNSYAYHRYHIERDFRSEINVPKARVVTVSDNPFGALKECRLWIRGYTLDMSRKELQISAQPNLTELWGQWHLVVHGRCYGHLAFDWQNGYKDFQKACPSKDDVKGLKLLLLGSFEDYISKGVPGVEGSERLSIHNDQHSAAKEEGGDEDADHVEEGCEERWSQRHTRDPETSNIGDDDSRHRQFQIPVRRGYGLIISPTGNDSEFRRVGAVFAGMSSKQCGLNCDSNLKELQSLAHIETVQLV